MAQPWRLCRRSVLCLAAAGLHAAAADRCSDSSLLGRAPTSNTREPVFERAPQCAAGFLPLAQTQECALNGYTCTKFDGPRCCDGRVREERACVPCDETMHAKRDAETYYLVEGTCDFARCTGRGCMSFNEQTQHICALPGGEIPSHGPVGQVSHPRTYFGEDISAHECARLCSETGLAGCCESRSASWGGCNFVAGGVRWPSPAHTDSMTSMCAGAASVIQTNKAPSAGWPIEFLAIAIVPIVLLMLFFRQRRSQTHGLAVDAIPGQPEAEAGAAQASCEGAFGPILGQYQLTIKWNGVPSMTVRPEFIEYKGVHILLHEVTVERGSSGTRLKFAAFVPDATSAWQHRGIVGLTETLDLTFPAGGSSCTGTFQRAGEGPITGVTGKRTLSLAQMAARLPPAKLLRKESSTALETECPICFRDFSDEVVAVLTECSHCFCMSCVVSVCKIKPPNSKGTCPLCRHPVDINNLSRVSQSTHPTHRP